MNGREYLWVAEEEEELDFPWWHTNDGPELEIATVLVPDKIQESENMSSKTLRTEDLNYFTGTENWYKFNIFSKLVLTDGAKYVADTGGAYWLMDEIALAQRLPKVKAEYFQFWKLTKQGSKATLTMTDGNDDPVWHKEIDWTDFPLDVVELWCKDDIIFLPSEY